jgi:hypothetical protein
VRAADTASVDEVAPSDPSEGRIEAGVPKRFHRRSTAPSAAAAARRISQECELLYRSIVRALMRLGMAALASGPKRLKARAAW